MAEGDGGGGKFILVVFLALLGLSALCCTGLWLGFDQVVETIDEEFNATVVGSGVPATQTRTVEPFREVTVVGATDVEITVGGEQSITVQADDNLLPFVKTEVADGKLSISNERSYTTLIGMRVLVTVPVLEGVSVVGASEVVATGVDSEKFSVKIVGAGDIRVSGKTTKLDVRVIGTGDMELFGLVSRDAVVVIQGPGDVNVHATESLDATINGPGDITYDGNPTNVKTTVSGSGDIEERGK